MASSSKQKQDLLKLLGVKYGVISSDIQEVSKEKEPDKYVKELALNKAMVVSKRLTDEAIIIGADTIIYCDNKIYEKPKTKEEARQNLIDFANKKNTAYTGLAIIDLKQNKGVLLILK